MDFLKRLLFSTTTMGLLLLVFLSSIGIATFVESMDSTEASKILIYNTFWFELVLVLLTANLIYNTFRYKMWRKEKLAVLTFHLSFIIILIGAGITRYTGEEGIIKVAENEAVSYMYSAEPFISITGLNVDGTQNKLETQKWFAKSTPSGNDFSLDFPTRSGNPLTFEYVAFIPNSVDSVKKADQGGSDILEFNIDGNSHFLMDNGIVEISQDVYVSFNNDSQSSAIQITSEMGDLFVQSPYDGLYKNMEELTIEDRSNPNGIEMDTLVRDDKHAFSIRTLYQIAGSQIVLKNFHSKSIMTLATSSEDGAGIDALVVNAVSPSETKQIVLKGGKGRPGIPFPFVMDDVQYMGRYGSKIVQLPFQVGLKEFRLKTYPGVSAPSSFESDIVVEDTLNGTILERTILMNNVLDYNGYRLFQSSYDSNLQSGDPNITLLSVNHDFWGTWVTYVGYFLMTLGFVITLTTKTSRFNFLSKSIKKAYKVSATVGLLGLSVFSYGQDADYIPVPIEHSDLAGKICVQDYNGRIKPLHTLSTEVLRKLYKNDIFEDQDPVQVYLGMMFRPDHWQEVPVLHIRNSDVRKTIGISGAYASFADFLYIEDGERKIKLESEQVEAFETPESQRSSYQKEILKTYDKLILLSGIFNKQGLKVFPIIGDKKDTWSSGTEPEISRIPTSIDSLSALQLLVGYEMAMKMGWEENDWTKANNIIKQIGKYQREQASHIVPSESRIEFEISYNKQHVFDKVWKYYFSVGLLILMLEVIFIASNVRNERTMKIFKWVSFIIVLGLTLWHGYGVASRAYIAERAPWSDGYEAMVFIGFMASLAGLIFSKSSRLIIGSGTLLAGIILMVAHHTNYDPNITPLVPVLKSIWLNIHVAIITGSYSFLGLGCLLGLLSLVLHILRGRKNYRNVTRSLDIITYISEMTMTIGLMMAAVGTFLGGVWANESWGRYWGWDAKETWALVIVLFYAMLLHFRFIPGMKSKFLFNAMSMWSFGTVIMTFFGVNYYLAGLHSYAAGDSPPIPTWCYYVVTSLVVLTVVATIRYNQTKKYKLD